MYKRTIRKKIQEHYVYYVYKLYYENTDVCLFKVQVYLEVVMITMEQNGP